MKILHPIHFNSLELFLEKTLQMDSNFSVPFSFKKIFPFFYIPLDSDLIKSEVNSLMNVSKTLNVLSYSLTYKNDYKGFLDTFIEENISLLEERTESKEISDREAYNALRLLLFNIRPRVIETSLRKLYEDERKCILFLELMCHQLAHYILEIDQNPFKYGELY